MLLLLRRRRLFRCSDISRDSLLRSSLFARVMEAARCGLASALGARPHCRHTAISDPVYKRVYGLGEGACQYGLTTQALQNDVRTAHLQHTGFYVSVLRAPHLLRPPALSALAVTPHPHLLSSCVSIHSEHSPKTPPPPPTQIPTLGRAHPPFHNLLPSPSARLAHGLLVSMRSFQLPLTCPPATMWSSFPGQFGLVSDLLATHSLSAPVAGSLTKPLMCTP